MKLYLFLFFSFSLLFSLFSVAQDKRSVDSLLKISTEIKEYYPDSAFKYNDKALKISRDLKDSILIGKALFGLAETYTFLGDNSAAINYLLEGKRILKAKKDTAVFYQVTMFLASVFLDQEKFVESKENYDEMMAMVKGNNDTLEAGIYNDISILYISKYYQKEDTATILLQKAIDIFKKRNMKLQEAEVYNSLGAVYAFKKNYDECIRYHLMAQDICKELNNEDALASTYKKLGDAYYYVKKKKESLDYYLKAYDIRNNKKNKSSVDIAIIACDVAYMYGSMNDLKNLRRFEEIAVKHAEQSQSVMEYICVWLGGIYEIIGDNTKALEYSKQLLAIKTNVMTKRSLDNLIRMENDMQVQHEREMQVKEKEMAAAREKHQTGLRNIFIIGFALTLVLLAFVFRNYRAKQKANVIIEKQKNEAESQKMILEEKNKEITDSINYAQKIQTAILPKHGEVKKIFPDHFIYYLPKDIVSGDFYWATEVDNKKIIAAVDCTGHGVPGAFMSIIGSSLLNEVVQNKKITEPAQILSYLKEGVIKALQQKGASGENQDGMDIALCTIENNRLKFAGAHNPACLVRNGEVIELPATKMPIGIFSGIEKPFQQTEIELQNGDAIYLFSDGYIDQFGGPQGKKFKYKQFKEVLISMSNQLMDDQKCFLQTTMKNWQGEYEQIDDILVIGMKYTG